jgi:branched-chain amino acid transport system substrate-binding protein
MTLHRTKSWMIAACAVVSVMGADVALSQTQGPIKIGVMGPNSGPYAIIGEEVKNGFDLYFSQIGYQAGGRKIEMIFEDTQAKPDVGLTKAKKLVELDGVSFVGGIVSSSVAYALRDYVVSKNVPLVVTVPVRTVSLKRRPRRISSEPTAPAAR